MFMGWTVRHTLRNFMGQQGNDLLRHYLVLTADPAEAVRWIRASGTTHPGDPIEVIAPQFA